MKPKEFLEWYRYNNIGGKRMYRNYGLLRRHNSKMFDKLVSLGRFKYKKQEMGKLLQFPKEEECNK